jgi:hypothetical protein
MADLLFVVITIVFFVVCVGYVHVCDSIIGPDPRPASDDAMPEAEREMVGTVTGS